MNEATINPIFFALPADNVSILGDYGTVWNEAVAWTHELLETSEAHSQRVMKLSACICASESIVDVCATEHMETMMRCFNREFMDTVGSYVGHIQGDYPTNRSTRSTSDSGIDGSSVSLSGKVGQRGWRSI